jgi:hypothetical protein
VRRRRDFDEDETPTELLVFEGFRYRTERAWAAAFVEFYAAREAWSEEHEGAVLAPYEVNGECPFDYSRFRKSTG